MTETVSIENVAQGYLALLRDRGIPYFLGTSGTDFTTLIDAFAKQAHDRIARPVPLTVAHEFVAVSMAHGYAMVTGEPLVVMVHVIVGTANGLCGIMNAARSRVPLIFTAGRTPITEAGSRGSRSHAIHWAQEAFDQGGLVREFVKWEFEVRHVSQLEAAVDRALAIATAEPCGPVYLSFPRELLADAQTTIPFAPGKRQPSGLTACPQPAAVAQAARLMAEAQRPLIITAGAGRDTGAVQALVAFAEAAAAPVVDGLNTLYMNFPTPHPLHLGFDPNPFLISADVVFVVDSDVPWLPSEVAPPDTARVVHIGPDPLYDAYPLRGFPADLVLPGNTAAALRSLTAEFERQRPPAEGVRSRRLDDIRRVHDDQQRRRRHAAAAQQRAPIDPVWLSACIDRVRDDDTILVNEADLDLTQIELTQPGSFFGASPASGLGWGVGAALGVKLARPDKTVIAAVGDGSYLFGAPAACHLASRMHDLPILVIVVNNHGWNAVRRATHRMHPGGWADRQNDFPLTALEPSPEYHRICAASGGAGERIEDPEALLPALRRALHVVRTRRRQCVLDVICRP